MTSGPSLPLLHELCFLSFALGQLSYHRHGSSSHGLINRLGLEIRVRCWALDDFLYCFFDFVPILGLNAQHSNTEIGRDLHQLSPASLVVDEGN